MKITKIEYRTVSVPFVPALKEHWGAEYPSTLIWVHTDEGITGVGESSAFHENIADKANEINARYVGRRVWDIDLSEEPFPFQCAFYDIVGQALEVPVHHLIGAKRRDRVEVAYWSAPMPAAATAAEAEKAAKAGFKVHKLKARSWNIVETAKLITKACGPDYAIRVDPNTQFGDISTAVRLARELLPYNVEVYEDPILFDDLSWYRQLRSKIEPPVARHLGSDRQIFLNMHAEAVDAINCGGNAASIRKNAAVAAAGGLPVWLQMFAFGTCVASTFAVHVACTIPNCTMAIDELPHIRINDLSGGSMELSDGAISVPDTPGLGVTLDSKAVEKYEVQ